MKNTNRKSTSGPIEAGKRYLKLKELGTSVSEIADSFGVSVPAVYKYIKLYQCGEDVHKLIRENKITATKVISLLHIHSGEAFKAAVKKEVKERTKQIKLLEKKGLTKMTVKRRLEQLSHQLDKERINTRKAKFLKEIASQINSGATVEELVELTK